MLVAFSLVWPSIHCVNRPTKLKRGLYEMTRPLLHVLDSSIVVLYELRVGTCVSACVYCVLTTCWFQVGEEQLTHTLRLPRLRTHPPRKRLVRLQWNNVYCTVGAQCTLAKRFRTSYIPQMRFFLPQWVKSLSWGFSVPRMAWPSRAATVLGPVPTSWNLGVALTAHSELRAFSKQHRNFSKKLCFSSMHLLSLLFNSYVMRHEYVWDLFLSFCNRVA